MTRSVGSITRLTWSDRERCRVAEERYHRRIAPRTTSPASLRFGLACDEAARLDADDHQHLGAIRRGGAVVARVRRHVQVRGHSVETELVALDVLRHEARVVVAIGRQ